MSAVRECCQIGRICSDGNINSNIIIYVCNDIVIYVYMLAPVCLFNKNRNIIQYDVQ